MKNIISFSLYGINDLYWKGALLNIELAKTIYPNYICRFYIDNQSPSRLINTIVGDNVEIILMNNRGGIDGMFWRFLGACDRDVDIFLCRDTDSRLGLREKLAVEEWLASDKDFHIMRDHPQHKTAMLGGMWGCRNQILCNRNLENKILSWEKFDKKGSDQRFLSNQIYYPIVKKNAIEHSSYDIKYNNIIYPFPTMMENNEFVGQVYNA
jgi:hypothetical protein